MLIMALLLNIKFGTVYICVERVSEANYLVPLGYIEGEISEMSAQAFYTI